MIDREPLSAARLHWRRECVGFISQMKVMTRHVGKKTGLEWAERIEHFEQRLRSSFK